MPCRQSQYSLALLPLLRPICSTDMNAGVVFILIGALQVPVNPKSPSPSMTGGREDFHSKPDVASLSGFR